MVAKHNTPKKFALSSIDAIILLQGIEELKKLLASFATKAEPV
jgi:hypothetical protein